MTEKQKHPKMGRPPLAPGKRRGPSMGFRPTPAVRAKLEEAATANGRSMSQEVEERLGHTFKEDEALGSMGLRALLLLFRTTAALVEQRTGKSCFDDWNTWVAVQAAWKREGETFGPAPPQEWKKALQKANEAVTGVLLEPEPKDADPGVWAAYLMKAVKGFQAVNTFYRLQRDQRAQEAIGEEIVLMLDAEMRKKESRMAREQAGGDDPKGETA